jgi:predicted aldo/keto reductase-like oxidoreductase
MLYRTMKKSDPPLSILGFGCMRLPQTPDGHIDEDAATAMVRAAIDGGVNYLDTAYVYHNGESEPFLGRALQGGYRERVQLATKLPVWRVESREDMDRYLDEQLRRLATDHIDFYLLHGLVRKSWDQVADLGVYEFLDEALADGRIRHAGFSFHDRVTVFKDIVDEYDWSFCQIQYNYMDEEHQAGTEGLRYAAEKGLGVIVMEPLRGGMLAKEAPGAREIWASSGSVRTPAEWGLRWVWNHPEVTVVLSGMSTMEQLRQNLGYADAGLPGFLPDAELAVYDEIRALYRSRVATSCTGCRYCMPCHSGVDIPACFAIYNDAFIYDDIGNAKFGYEVFTGFGGAASQCQDCGVCEDLCPQRIPIRKKLKEVARLLGK